MKKIGGIIGHLVNWSIDQKRIVYALVIAFVVSGLVGMYFMNKDEFPSFEIKQGLVVAIYPGADADEVEEHLTSKLEEILCRIPEVRRDNLKSVSQDGICYIYTDLNCPTPKKDEIWSKIKLRLQAERISLPKGVLAVAVLDDFNSISSVLVALESDDKGYSELKEYAENLSREFRKIPELAKVEILGTQEEEIAVTIDKDKLSAYGISPSSLMLKYQTNTLQLPEASFSTNDVTAPIKVMAGVASEREVAEKIIYSDPQGNIIRLKDIATIERKYKDPDKYVTYNGHSCIVLSVSMLVGNDIVAFGRDVDVALKKFMKDMPDSVTISRISDLPKVVGNSVSSFLRDLVLSMVVVIAVMLLLFSMKSALIAGSGVPVGTAITIAIMFFAGIDLNTVTLAGLIVVLGMIVDNSIITMDGYMNYLGMGYSKKEAAIASINELFAPTLAATLAISLMFFPAKKLITGYIGEFIKLFPWVILIALMVSLLYAVIVVPSLEIRFISSAVPEGKGFLVRAQNRLFKAIENGYSRAEKLCFRHPHITLGVGVLTIVLALLMFSTLNVQMMPKAARDFFAVEIQLESGNNIDNTKEVVDSLQQILLADERVESVTSFIGTGAPRFVATYAPVLPGKTMAQLIVNTRSIEATEALLDEYENRYEHLFPNAIVRFKQMDYQDAEAPVMVTFKGNDRDSLYPLAEEVKMFMSSLTEETKWVHSTADDYRARIDLNLDDVEASRLGINKTMLSLAMSGIYNGINLGTILENGESVPVNMYTLGVDDDMKFDNVEGQVIPTVIPGVNVPVSQIAGMTPDWSHAMLERYNGVESITVFADLKSGVSQPHVMEQVDRYIKSEIEPRLPEGCEIEYKGLTSSNEGLIPEIVKAVLAAICVLLIFMVLHFKKLSLAILTLVMSLLCLFGAFFGLWIFKLDFGITAVLGIISLIGIIVRNGIIMYEYAEELRIKKGMDVKTAAMLSGSRRVTPIFLTSCTTALGVIPMVLGKDLLWQPMGIVICFGTILSIFLIVFIMPVSYWQVYKNLKPVPVAEEENETGREINEVEE